MHHGWIGSAARIVRDRSMQQRYPVSMEVLTGARNEHHRAQLLGLLGRATMLPTTPADYDAAAALYCACRVRGETVRKPMVRLIAAVAIRAGAEILHADTDFTVLARRTKLRTHAASTH